MNYGRLLLLAQRFQELSQEDNPSIRKAAKEDKGKAEWIYHVDIFEPEGVGMGYPVVRHSFYGKTKKEAKGYFESHMKTDEFMSDCVKKDKWEDVKCKSKFSWEKIK